MKSKNKLVPRLLGITKESVMRVDEKTKDVVQEWPLTTVKRWAASPKSFTLVRATFSTFKPKTCSTFITESRSSEYFMICWLCWGVCFIFILFALSILSLMLNKSDRLTVNPTIPAVQTITVTLSLHGFFWPWCTSDIEQTFFFFFVSVKIPSLCQQHGSNLAGLEDATS